MFFAIELLKKKIKTVSVQTRNGDYIKKFERTEWSI
jgi:hypothetical protein